MKLWNGIFQSLVRKVLADKNLQCLLELTWSWIDDVISFNQINPNLIGIFCQSSCQNLVNIALPEKELQPFNKSIRFYILSVFFNPILGGEG